MIKLKLLRQARGYSCQAMANKLHISKSFYWQLENSKRRLSYELAIQIATIFKMKPDELFYDDFKDL